MSVARFFSGLFAADTIGDAAEWRRSSTWFGGRMRTDTGMYVSEHAALNLPVVYAAVGLLSDVLATAPAQVVDIDEDTGLTTQVKHDPRELMLNLMPSEYMTAFTCRQTTQAHTLLWGNGYCEIKRNRFGQAEGLWPLPAGSIAPVVVGNPGNQTIRYQGSVAGEQFDKPADEVLHLRGLGLDGLVGLSPIAMARQALGLGLAMEKYGAKLFANDSRSGGYVSGVPAGLSTEGMTNLREYVNQQSGLDNAHSVKILEGDMKFTPGGIPPDDAQFLGSREFTIAEFARMYRVPLELLQAQGKTSSWGSGIEQLFLAFVSFTLQPWITQWQQEMSMKLLTTQEMLKGRRVVFNIEDMKRGDSAARAAFAERMIGSKVLTPNEARQIEGLNPLDGGDEFPEAKQPAGPDRTREDDVERKDEAA